MLKDMKIFEAYGCERVDKIGGVRHGRAGVGARGGKKKLLGRMIIQVD